MLCSRIIPRRVLVVAVTFLMLGASCRVKRSAYQTTLEKFYRTQLTQEGEAGLQAAIQQLTEALDGNPTDAGLLALRANAYLDLLRVKLEASDGKFDPEAAKQLYGDLRLLERLDLTVSNSPAWIKPRIRTIAGDVLMLRASAVAEGGGSDALLLALYGGARDYYLYAAAAAKAAQTATAALEAGAVRDQAALSTMQELDKARDGYVNALLGMGQSEDFLGLSAASGRRFEEALTYLLKADAEFPPPPPAQEDPDDRFRIPISLYPFGHQQLSKVTVNLINHRFPQGFDALSREDKERWLSHWEFALREWLVGLMLAYGDFRGDAVPVEDDSRVSTLQVNVETAAQAFRQPADGGSQ